MLFRLFFIDAAAEDMLLPLIISMPFAAMLFRHADADAAVRTPLRHDADVAAASWHVATLRQRYHTAAAAIATLFASFAVTLPLLLIRHAFAFATLSLLSSPLFIFADAFADAFAATLSFRHFLSSMLIYAALPLPPFAAPLRYCCRCCCRYRMLPIDLSLPLLFFHATLPRLFHAIFAASFTIQQCHAAIQPADFRCYFFSLR